MNYLLAKELKDANFPLNPHRDWEMSDFAWLPSNEITRQEREKLWIPTLSELIEACGEEFGALLRVPTGKFQAMGGNLEKSEIEGKGMYAIQVLGDTPEVACAKLWLALNPKEEIKI